MFVAPPKGTPVISKIEELFGENNKLFNCTGNQGYPTGNLKVKFKDDKDFQDYDFHNINRTNTDRKCIRKQVVKVKYLFSMKWTWLSYGVRHQDLINTMKPTFIS